MKTKIPFKNLKLGQCVETVSNGDGTPIYGIIEHIGILRNSGKEDSIWANWVQDKKDIILAKKPMPASEGGDLFYSRHSGIKRLCIVRREVKVRKKRNLSLNEIIVMEAQRIQGR